MALTPFTRSTVEALPVEARLVRKVFKALKDAGKPVTHVHDGEELVPVKTRDDVLEVVFSVDASRIMTEDGSWVLIILGNGWDVVSDYTTNLEDALKPVNDYAMENES